MAWDPTLIGMEESRLVVLKALVVANLASLNTSLTRDGLWPSTVPITAAMVTLGDTERWPTSKPPILLCVTGGGRGDELDIETEIRMIDPSATQGFKNKLYTNLLLYIHPDTIQNADPLVEAATREILRVRICDWARAGVFNNLANRVLTLASREYNVAPNYDRLDRCIAKQGYKGYFQKGFGSSLVCYGAHIVHEGLVM